METLRIQKTGFEGLMQERCHQCAAELSAYVRQVGRCGCCGVTLRVDAPANEPENPDPAPKPGRAGFMVVAACFVALSTYATVFSAPSQPRGIRRTDRPPVLRRIQIWVAITSIATHVSRPKEEVYDALLARYRQQQPEKNPRLSFRDYVQGIAVRVDDAAAGTTLAQLME
jgi:hypothetical protein